MGEISFNYGIDAEPVYEARFKYWFAESIEYSFAYQRYIAFSDASIFNSPVAITKVATGLYQYYDLFLDKKAHATMYGNLIKNFDKVQYDTDEKSQDPSLDKTHRDVEKHQVAYRITRPYSFYLERYQDGRNAYKDDPIGNKYSVYSLTGDIKIGDIHLEEYWLLKDYALNIYYSPIIEKVYYNKLDVYGKMYQLSRTNHMQIQNSGIMMTLFDNELSIYDVLLGTPFDNELNIMNTAVFGKAPDKKLNVIENISLEPFRLEMNILDIYFGCRDDIVINRIPQIFLKYPYVLQGNIVTEGLFTKRPEVYQAPLNQIVVSTGGYKYAEMNESFTTILDNRYAVLNNAVTGRVTDKYVALNDFVQGYTYGQISNAFSIVPAFKVPGRTNILDKIKELTRIHFDAFYDVQYSLYLYNKPVCRFDLDTFVVSEQRHCFVIDGVTTTANFDNLQVFDNMYQVLKGNQNVFRDDKPVFIDNSTKDIFTSTMVVGNKGIHGLQSDEMQVFAFKNDKMMQRFDNPVFIGTTGKNLHGYYKHYFIDKNSNEMDLYDHVFIGKFSKSFELYPNTTWANLDKTSMVIQDSALDVNKDRKSFIIDDSSTPIAKDKLSMDADTLHFVSASKDNMGMNLPEHDILQASKDGHQMYIFTDEWAAKHGHNISVLHQYFADKDKHYISIYQQIQSGIKSKLFTDAPDFDTVIKNHLPTDYINTLHNSYAGMIIPISKVRHQGYIDNIDRMVQKVAQDGYLNQDTGASVIPKDTHIASIDLFCDKKEFKAYIDYRNNQITKSKLHGFIAKSTFINKTPRYTALEGSIWAEKDLARVWSDKQLEAQKKANRGDIEGILSVKVASRDVYAYDSLFVDKTSQMCYYNYGTTWADKTLEARFEKQYSVDRKQQELHMFDCVSPFIKEQLDVFYNYGVFTSKIIRESDLFKQIHDVHRKAYDTGIQPEDFGNWAWVYETPDPFDGLGFGIDELLLPENDTRYEDFQDIIFDKQNMRPRNPVKVIDDHTFIAKYPIKHPLPKYSDIAVNYDDSAIKLENFYGIETGIVHTVFLKFYRIWQSKIFEFGTMTMVQSVKLMLEYMYAWIMEYFPVEDIEQALRVFKLIRWYGETSIIQNSQYIISYEYDTLESKLNTGTCHIPNDLLINDTMYVDAHLGVIRNNPAYINTSTGAYVTFEIDNRKNTTFTFSLSNTVGSVNIYINDVLVDVLARSALNLTYELPYTGDTNVIKIEKVASHNLNGNFYIGNIKVPHCSFKDLSIEFDPTLKAGNKPLNEIAKKMIAFANLHENRDEAYELIRKGNLGVGEIYKRLVEYWEIHHKDKLKGRRLTIKEV